jgi:hypothetical protein
MEGPYFHRSHVDGFLPEEATAYDLGHRLVCGKSFFLSFFLANVGEFQRHRPFGLLG